MAKPKQPAAEESNIPQVKHKRKLPKSLKRKREQDELSTLEKSVQEFDTKTTTVTTFTSLPLSKPTLSGLDKSHFKLPTDIQKKSLPLTLKGRDILGAAKTGSGKTLAFLIPVLEVLYRKKWSQDDGLGALIISPTRELAIQIFQVLRQIGQKHSFSAGLVIGGKNLQEERERLGRMNILVCTPGRMKQHLEQNPDLDVYNLQVLVLDEADRILDMGFKESLDAIIDGLPKDRQTLLFSATQTKNVSDLARLSLKDPEYISVHETATTATPSKLQQNYIITPLNEKLDTLYSFIKSNLKSKILVFFSSTKQVRFTFETFKMLQPGIPLLHLHGKQKQTARLEICEKFSNSKNSCLFSTDIVARGLDFPAVDWVIQVDCPEDSDTYIHRVGRTARYQNEGKGVLFLTPSEESSFLSRLSSKKIPIEKINVKQSKKISIKNQLQGFCFKDPEIKYLGQKAFVSYVRSIYVQKDKDVFKLEELPLAEFAESLGLPGQPKIKFMKGEDVKARKNAPRGLLKDFGSSDDEEGDGERKEKEKEKKQVRTKYDRMFERQNQNILTSHFTEMIKNSEPGETGEDKEEEEDFLTIKSHHQNQSQDSDSDSPKPKTHLQIHGSTDPLIIDSKRREKLITSKKALLKYKQKGTKLVFDDEGNSHALYEFIDEDEFKRSGDVEVQRGEFLKGEKEKIMVEDLVDKGLEKEKRRVRKEKRKLKSNGDDDGEEVEFILPDGDHVDPFDQSRDQNHDDSGEEEEVERPKKKQKKWLENDEQDEKKLRREKKRKSRIVEMKEAPETLEDLESLAAGLLG